MRIILAIYDKITDDFDQKDHVALHTKIDLNLF